MNAHREVLIGVRIREFLSWVGSGKTISWIFASAVFGSYVVSLEAALLESSGYYGPWAYFTTGHLANMVLPIEIAIYVWILVSVLLLFGQFIARPIRSGLILIGVFSMVLSLITYGTLAISLAEVHVRWFVGYLNLPVSAKFLVGGVSAAAFGYVFLSPLMWDKVWCPPTSSTPGSRRPSTTGQRLLEEMTAPTTKQPRKET